MNFSLTSDILAELPASAVAVIDSWLADLHLVDQANPRDPVVKLVAARRAVSVRTIYNKYKAVITHGPKALLDGRHERKLSQAPVGHRSPAFIQWVHGLYYETTRTNATPSVQYRMLAALRAWHLDPTNPGLRIPGYDFPPPHCPESRFRHPAGWSIRNLNDLKPGRYQRAEGGKGRHASSLLLPPVLTTRVGLAVGAAYMLDDQYFDLLVHYGAEPVRPVGLNVLDLASGCDVVRGIRPFLKDNPEGDKGLTRAHSLWLIVHLLTTEGYHKDGCIIYAESGSATLDQEFRRFLSLASDGKIKVEIGEVSKELVRGVLTPSKGNPRFKAARESWFNLFRNRMAHLPLSLGHNPDSKPEDTDRLAVEDKHLLSILPHLHPSVIGEMQFEGLPWSRFLPAANLVSEAINRRTEHDLEGWASMGRERVQFLVGGQWIDEPEWLDLAPDTRALVTARMHRGEVVSRLSKLSPREVYEAGRPALKTLSPWHWDKLIPPSMAIRRTVPANRQLVVDRREYGPEPIVFRSFYLPLDGEERPMPAGAEILLYLSPVSPGTALAVRADGRPLGLVHSVVTGLRTDQDALHAQYADRQRLRIELAPTAAEHNNTLAKARQSRREQNATVLRNAGVDEKKISKIATPSSAHKKAQTRGTKKRITQPKDKPFKDPSKTLPV